MKALVYRGEKTADLVDRPVPPLRDNGILVKTVAVGTNPTDFGAIAREVAAPGCTLGVDFAGIVEEVGSGVTKPFKKGDRICGFIHGGNTSAPDDGAFAEYLVAIGDLTMKIPDHITFEEAATLGTGLGTVGQGLFKETGLNLSHPSNPTQTPETVLLYGGSTATGTLGIQFLKAWVSSMSSADVHID